MKPSFALDFRNGHVALLHRTSRGWSQVGSTSFDAPDMVEALGYMRATALGLSPRGITTKLIIPNEQILYTEIHAPGPEPAKRRRPRDRLNTDQPTVARGRRQNVPAGRTSQGVVMPNCI